MVVMKYITRDIIQNVKQLIGAQKLRESFGLSPGYVDICMEYREIENDLYETVDSIAIGIDSQF